MSKKAQTLAKQPLTLMVPSDQAGLYTVFLSLGLSEADEVLIPSTAPVRVITPLLELGVLPVTVNASEYSLDLIDLKTKLSTATKALILVVTPGKMINLDELQPILAEFNIPLIEYVVQSSDTTSEELSSPLGLVSFVTNDTATSGVLDQGVILTHDKQLYLQMKQLSQFGHRVTRSPRVMN